MLDRLDQTLFGYVRVSTDEQANNGYGLASQESLLREACERRGFQLATILRDEGLSAKNLVRPGLWAALERIAMGEADGLIVAKLDRLTRSVIDFSLLLDWFDRARVTLIVLDLDIDTSTPSGELMANVMAAFAQFERKLIGQRTKDGLATARRNGVHVGRTAVTDDPALVAYIWELSAAGRSAAEIARVLNEDGVPTVRGGLTWRQSSIQTVLGYERRPRRKTIGLPEVRRAGRS